MNTTDARTFVQNLIDDYFPEDGTDIGTGQQGFDHIAKDYMNNGTTCGFLPHWLLWRAGCASGVKINRFEPDDGLQYTDGENITRLDSVKAFVGKDLIPHDLLAAMKDPSKNLRPKGGDAVVLSDADLNRNSQNFVHTFVFLGQNTSALGGQQDTLSWKLAETGAGSDAQHQKGHKTTREIHLDGKRYPFPWCVMAGNDRRVLGWLSLDGLSFEEAKQGMRNGDFLKRPAAFNASYSLRAKLMGKWQVGSTLPTPWQGWYHFYKGGRVFYTTNPAIPYVPTHIDHKQVVCGNEGTQYAYDDKGVWFTSGGVLQVRWYCKDIGCTEYWTDPLPDPSDGKLIACVGGSRPDPNDNYSFMAKRVQPGVF